MGELFGSSSYIWGNLLWRTFNFVTFKVPIKCVFILSYEMIKVHNLTDRN